MITRINKLNVAFSVFIVAAYCLGAAYWHIKKRNYWACVNAPVPPNVDVSCGIRPNGPLYMLLFVLIPAGIATLFVLIYLSSHMLKKGSKNE